MRAAFGRLWLDTFFARKQTTKTPSLDLAGKQVVFTGGTDGLGRIAVDRFAEMGADICLIGRSAKKTQQVLDDLTSDDYRGQFSMIECDMGSLDQVRHASSEVLARFDRINYLINCAGVNLPERQLTHDGLEMNFVVNYLGPFLFTELLLDKISSTPTARIINLTSGTQEVANLDFDDIHLENGWSMLKSYAQAKLCVIMHGRDLAKRLEGSDTSINSLNPGYIATNITRHTRGFERLFTKVFGHLAAPTWVGGERIIAAALGKEYREFSGHFIYEDRSLPPNPIALDDAKVRQLMELSYQLTGLEPKTH